ncbi:oxidoreductase [Yinghuangia soli]|uniref:Oxidoreductase n=1 Tax=Yinghuangia soli TaxID=2908204 RepID=A0AA41PVJ9_9ACTN|nr:oxidoreductase [Yinghuangia soli]MCF2526145.1 oxidoreductase [Yinghuangia soli]
MADGIPAHLGTLGRAEQLLWDAYPHGGTVDVSALPDPERTLRGAVVAALLLGAREPDPGRVPAVRLTGAAVTGPLDVGGGSVDCELALTGCTLTDTPVFSEATLRSIALRDCRLPGLRAELARFEGGLLINRSTVAGQIRLTRSTITGEVHLDGSQVTGGPGKVALFAGGLVVESAFFAMGGTVFDGGVRIPGARLDGGAFLQGAVLRNPGGEALHADNLATHILDCTGLTAEGMLRLKNITISGELILDDVHLSNPGAVAVHLGRAEVGYLTFRPGSPVAGRVNITYGQYGVILDDPASWPADLGLDGTVYNAVQMAARPLAVVDRLDWLSRDSSGYRPQPYEQLAAYYRTIGHDDLARRVLLEKERRHRRTLTPLRRALSCFLDWTVGYGYHPARALLWLLTLAVVGAVVFSLDRPAPTGSSAGTFNAVVYTLDLLLPLSVFDQRSQWTPMGASAWVGYTLRAAGWLLTTAVIAGLTRVLNRR